jgi:hypothetical protein
MQQFKAALPIPSDLLEDVLVIMAVVVIIALSVIPVASSMMIFPVFVTAVTMLLLITRNILAVVPVVLHKEYPLPAGVVFAAMPSPVPGVAWRHAQIDRFALHRYHMDYPRLRIDHSRLRKVANVDSTIEARLTDANRNPNVRSECRSGEGSGDYCCYKQKWFHVEFPVFSCF